MYTNVPTTLPNRSPRSRCSRNRRHSGHRATSMRASRHTRIFSAACRCLSCAKASSFVPPTLDWLSYINFRCFSMRKTFLFFFSSNSTRLTDGNVPLKLSLSHRTCPSISHLYDRRDIACLPCVLTRVFDKTERPMVWRILYAAPISSRTMVHYSHWKPYVLANMLRWPFDLLLHQLCKQDQLRLCKYCQSN